MQVSAIGTYARLEVGDFFKIVREFSSRWEIYEYLYTQRHFTQLNGNPNLDDQEDPWSFHRHTHA
jgi:hypothetical protein